ncbi:hypothetical protein BLNAU_11306 [Blattamonas nauphoetae]|uniref:Integrase n=1 Tax=Blattamonas nauphoetae TaxID=2049346 RepID=A0ABQ9XPU2_9EUKA|nr:hypothetical protein BLNAU_11306 [Blattamonas nauphoetae]
MPTAHEKSGGKEVETKHGETWWNPQVVVITTHSDPDRTYIHTHEELGQLRRRTMVLQLLGVAAILPEPPLDLNQVGHSLKKTVRGALLTLNSIHTGQPTPRAMYETIKAAIKLVKAWKKTPDPSCAKPPCLISDLTIILQHIPDTYPKKVSEASLFLFSICCGARASTCAEVRLADILRIICLPDSDVLLVTFRLRNMKGSSSTTMNVTMEGSPFDKETVNVIYWLDLHLRSSFGLSLITFESWGTIIDLETRLWMRGTDAMRTPFQKRAFQAGFPINHFGFHSFSSGFISSAI